MTLQLRMTLDKDRLLGLNKLVAVWLYLQARRIYGESLFIAKLPFTTYFD